EVGETYGSRRTSAVARGSSWQGAEPYSRGSDTRPPNGGSSGYSSNGCGRRRAGGGGGPATVVVPRGVSRVNRLPRINRPAPMTTQLSATLEMGKSNLPTLK